MSQQPLEWIELDVGDIILVNDYSYREQRDSVLYDSTLIHTEVTKEDFDVAAWLAKDGKRLSTGHLHTLQGLFKRQKPNQRIHLDLDHEMLYMSTYEFVKDSILTKLYIQHTTVYEDVYAEDRSLTRVHKIPTFKMEPGVEDMTSLLNEWLLTDHNRVLSFADQAALEIAIERDPKAILHFDLDGQFLEAKFFTLLPDHH